MRAMRGARDAAEEEDEAVLNDDRGVVVEVVVLKHHCLSPAYRSRLLKIHCSLFLQMMMMLIMMRRIRG
jgi:hypothetical protein